MKPGHCDRKHMIRITGDELVALKACCIVLPESFGLDRRIAAYEGKRAIGFWRWDLDCLVDVLDQELRPVAGTRLPTRRRRQINRKALEVVYERLRTLREEAYREIAR